MEVIKIRLTNECNLRCYYCQSWDTPPLSLSVRNAYTISKQIFKTCVNNILLTGGEPLANKEIFEIIALFANLNIPISMCSNGFSDKIYNQIIMNNVDELYISLWGIKPQTHNYLRGIESFDKVVNNLSNINKNDCKHPDVVLFMTVTPENLMELPFLPKFAADLHCKRIAIQPVDIRQNTFDLQNSRVNWENTSLNDLDQSFKKFIDQCLKVNIITPTENEIAFVRNYITNCISSKNINLTSCNAPYKSIVVEPDLSCRACYFTKIEGLINYHSSLSNIHSNIISRWNKRNKACYGCICPKIY